MTEATQLKPESFNTYPPEARALVVQHLDLLRQMPLILLPFLLREAITYDWRFPTERSELNRQFAYLTSLSRDHLATLLSAFSQLTLTGELAQSDWVNTPSVFVEQLTAHLWATNQMDKFRSAAEAYAASWQSIKPAESTTLPRLGIVVIGKGVASTRYKLFRKLRPNGVYFNNVSTEAAFPAILEAVTARAQAYPLPYDHWYVDGGDAEPVSTAVTTISYEALKPSRTALLNRMQSVIQSGSAGPEALRTVLAQLKPQDIGLPADGNAAILGHFQMNLLTEGSGTQIFATTFAQWAARETLRRAQPSTLLVRFAPRQKQLAMNELLSSEHPTNALDPEGSLIDADMAAYYTWLNQQRLPGANQSSFLAWFEGQQQAVAIGPSLPRGTSSTTPTTLKQILSWLA
jgi:hypothetical protein